MTRQMTAGRSMCVPPNRAGCARPSMQPARLPGFGSEGSGNGPRAQGASSRFHRRFIARRWRALRHSTPPQSRPGEWHLDGGRSTVTPVVARRLHSMRLRPGGRVSVLRVRRQPILPRVPPLTHAAPVATSALTLQIRAGATIYQICRTERGHDLNSEYSPHTVRRRLKNAESSLCAYLHLGAPSIHRLDNG